MSERTASFPSTLIRASAGSGKTRSLTNRYLALLLAGEDASRILATSFTRKAANEIRQRVFMRLAEGALHKQAAEELANSIDRATLTSEQVANVLERLVEEQNRIHISTLDSFFSDILNSFALQLGISPNWRMLEAAQSKSINRTALRAVFQSLGAAEVSSLLRLLYKGESSRALHENLESEMMQLAALYFESNSSAWDFIEPPTALSKDELAELRIQIREMAPPLNKKDQRPSSNWLKSQGAAAAALASGNWEGLLESGLAKKILANEAQYDRKNIDEKTRALFQRLLLQARAILLQRLKQQSNATYSMLHHFCKELESLKQGQGRLEYDDVKRILARAALFGDSQELYYRLDCRIAHLLLDEFQDTSRLEWLVLDPFIAEVLSKAQIENSFFCVGDSKQAIYGWRGGVAEIFTLLDQNKSISCHSSLDKSYRSAPTIIEVVNRLFGSLQDNAALHDYPQAVAEWSERFAPHSAHHLDRSGYVELKYIKEEADTPFDHEEAEESSGSAVLKHAAQLVAQLNLTQPHLSIAVLFRRNKLISTMMQELARLPNPIYASEEGGNPLTDSSAVVLVLALLALLDHPGDTLLAFRVANSPLGKPLQLDSFQDTNRAKQALDRVRVEVMQVGLASALGQWANLLSAHISKRDKERLEQLIMLAAQHAHACARFTDFVRLVSDKRIESPSPATVRVMTIHNAKGLEFDAVVLPELDDAILQNSSAQYLLWRDTPLSAPSRICRYASAALRQLDPALQEMHQQMQTEHVKEALSVLYVALTRARYGLYMLSGKAKRNLSFGGIVRSALLADEEERFCVGDANWAEKLSKPSESAQHEQEVLPFKRQAWPFKERRFVHRTPSSHEGGESALESALSLESKASMARGSLIHKLFEQISWLDEPLSSGDLLALLDGNCPPNFDKDELLGDFAAFVNFPAVRAVLQRSQYTGYRADELQLFREQVFAFRDENGVCQGSFDRLVTCSKCGGTERAELIDFKTDKLQDDGELERLIETYRPQVEAYKRGAAVFCGIEQAKVCGLLVFVRYGKVVSI